MIIRFQIKNPTYVFVCLGETMDLMLIMGLSTFGTKLLHELFGVGLMNAGTILGTCTHFDVPIIESVQFTRKTTFNIDSHFSISLLKSNLRMYYWKNWNQFVRNYIKSALRIQSQQSRI